MKNIMKKICICGASLMMITSLGAGINNVSARRVHHHARTHRITTNNRYLFNQGRNDGKRYGRNFNIVQPATSLKYSDSTYNNVMLHLIENHYNHLYQHGFKAGMNDAVGGHQPSVIQNIGFLTRRAKKLARHHHLNSHNVYAYFHKDTRPKYIKRHAKKSHKSNKKSRRAKLHHNRKYNSKKRNKKQITKRHTVKRNRKLREATKKRINKRNNHKAKRVTNVKKSTNSTNNAPTTLSKHNTSSAQSSQPYDETDSGKYYSWSQLQNVMNSDAVENGYESDATEQKINDTIMHNLNHYNYKQDDALLSNGEGDALNNISPDLFNKVNNAYGFAYGMRKVL